ncbi:glutathione hydrolase 1 proenzyme-like [Styela clava]
MSGGYSQGSATEVQSPNMAKSSRAYLGIGFLVGVLIGLALFFGLYFGLPPPKCTNEVNENIVNRPNNAEYSTAAVASDAGPCSEIGTKILKKGGSVVDAGIATMVCGGLYNPQSAGIGGGSFMSVFDAKTGDTLFINSRETAPLAADKDMFDGNGFLSQIGSRAIAVPGEVAGYWEAHQRYGLLPWEELFEDSIKIAYEGMRVSLALERDIAKEEQYIMNSTFNLKPIFTNPDGSLKKEGDIIVRPTFAQTLRAIADEGIHGFYNGTLAKRIVADIEDAVEDSIITIEDLNKYQVEVKPLLNISIGNNFLYTPGPPSSGAVLTLILNILNGYEFTPDSLKGTQASILTYHRIVEAFKFAYAHRSELGDERFNDDVRELVANMTSPSYAEELRLKISDETTQPSAYYGGDFARLPNDFGTSHISIVDKNGNAFSATGTINLRFGSKVRGIRTGIIFNDEMDDFSSPNVTNYFGLPPSPNNFIAPGKRPMSSMVPTIVLDKNTGKIRMATGASGGTKITTGTGLVAINTLWFGDSLQDATSRTRIHHQLFPEYIQYEEGFNMDVIAGLQAKNHEVQSFAPPGSVVQSILTSPDNGDITAVSDERKGGYPDGY